MNALKKLPKHSILALAVILAWVKTDIAYLTSFKLGLDNFMQYLILLINPLSFLLFVLGLSLFFKSVKARNRYILIVSFILSFVLYGNVAFYRFYNDFVTLPVLFQTSNFGDLGSSVTDIVMWYDIFYFVDTIILALCMKFLPQLQEQFVIRKQSRKVYFILSVAVLFLNLGLAEIERPQLLTRSFDREILVKNIGTYNYHLYDIYVQSKSSAQRALADGSELVEVSNYIQANQVQPDDELFGKYAGRNVIYISLESLQNFVINKEMNGHVITPFLNSLTNDKDTYYFSDFYHQTGLGKTSDAEFIIENSLFGLGRGAVYFTHGENTYNSLSEKLGEAGYSTSVMHANNRSFWNRDRIYQSFNVGMFYDVASYEVTEENSVGWGLKDIPFFKQSADILAQEQQPFFTRMITLTNHFPFSLNEEDIMIPEYDSNSNTLNRYFQTVRYLDEAVKSFFDDLKEQGLYDNSIIVMYGDHYGISENHNKAMAQYLNKEQITPYDTALLQSVPLFIHIPGSGDGQEIDTATGQIDLRPTILHLLGIDTSKDIQLGMDLFSPDYEDLVIFRDGRFVTDELVYASEVCYNRATGEEIDVAACQPYFERVNTELEYSDKIINGDLLRFYDYESGSLIEK